MRKRRLNRVDVYLKICKRLGLKPEGKAPGYFSTARMRRMAEYIEKMDLQLKEAKNASK